MGGDTGESSVQRSAADIGLPVVVPSHADHGAVGLKPHGVIVACGDHLWSEVGGDSVGTVHGNGG